MRILFYCTILFFVFGLQDLYSQCDFVIPPAIKKTHAASREITFSGVTINGKRTTYLEVKKGETVKIKTFIESKQNGNYCPHCIVQIYWGVRGYASVCAKSFYGYNFNKQRSKLKFKAPMKDGIYYITMGASLDYSCKNSNTRPRCSPNNAFAVIKVGNPDPESKIELTKIEKDSSMILSSRIVNPGCFVDLNKIEWFKDGEKLEFNNKKEIPISEFGTYKVSYSNCLTSIADSLTYTKIEPKLILPSPVQVPDTIYSDDIEDLIKKKNKFVLKNLIFGLGRYHLRPNAKKELDKLAKIMKDKPSMKILLEGHTDNRGRAKPNLKLSERRVRSAKKYLVKQGVKRRNIKTKGYGHERPLVITDDIEAGKVNRRVEILILSR